MSECRGARVMKYKPSARQIVLVYSSSDPRNVCTSKTPVYTEEILPSNIKKAQHLFTPCQRAIDRVEKQERGGALHFVAVI